jgi:hypothetical protein
MNVRGMLFALVLVGCTKPEDYTPKQVASAAEPPPSALTPPLPLPKLPAHFGAAEIAKAECVKLEGAELRGKDCPGGFAVFGPYATAAAGQDVSFSFALKASEDVNVMVEMVGETGKLLFAALDGSARKDELTRFSLRTRPQVDTKTLEARVVVGNPKKISYAISDLALDVR